MYRSMAYHASLPHRTETQRRALHQPVTPASKVTPSQRKPSREDTPLPGSWNYSVWNVNNTGIWVPLHLLVNICAVNGAGTHLPIIFSLPQSAHKIRIKRSTSPSLKQSTTKTECWLWISFYPFWHFNATSHNRYNTESDKSLVIPTRGRKVGLTGTIAVLEGRTRTG